MFKNWFQNKEGRQIGLFDAIIAMKITVREEGTHHISAVFEVGQ
jgi:hypothetical protein